MEETKETQKTPEASGETKAATAVSSSSGGNKAALIIIIVIVVLAALGVGGYFGYKYVKNRINKVTGTTTATPTSGKVNVKTVIDAFKYPGSTVTEERQDANSSYKGEIFMDSNDTPTKIAEYYSALANTKKWTVTTKGANGTDYTYMTITDGTFTAEIYAMGGTDVATEIGVKISGDNLVSGGLTTTGTVTATTTTAVATKTTTSSSSDYVISDSNTRVIAKSELTSLTPWKLKIARNEIYARHGREFVHKDLQCYFAKKSWYTKNPNFNESSLSSTETKNVATIQAYEVETSSPLASSDSGCDTNS